MLAWFNRAKATATDPKVTIKDHYDHHLNMVDDIINFHLKDSESAKRKYHSVAPAEPVVAGQIPWLRHLTGH